MYFVKLLGSKFHTIKFNTHIFIEIDLLRFYCVEKCNVFLIPEFLKIFDEMYV